MQEQPIEGTREQKRSQTFRRIHEAAVELTLRNGLAAATVNQIAERAGVSRRTFFNYYPSKEDAVLGVREPQIPPRALREFLDPVPEIDDDAAPGKRRFTAALKLTVTTMAFNGVQPDSRLQAVISAHPELIDRVRAHRDATQELLVTALSEQVAERTASPRAADSARALILLAGAVLRFAYSDDPDILDDPDPAAISAAMTTFRNALKELV